MAAQESPFWWKKESEAEKTLRLLIQKTGELGRLPTFDEVNSDANMPAPMTISFYCGGFEPAMQKVASLLFGSSDCSHPEDLAKFERALSESEQVAARQRRQELYQQRLKQLVEPGGVKALQQQIRDGATRRSEVAVTRIPTKERINLADYRKKDTGTWPQRKSANDSRKSADAVPTTTEVRPKAVSAAERSVEAKRNAVDVAANREQARQRALQLAEIAKASAALVAQVVGKALISKTAGDDPGATLTTENQSKKQGEVAEEMGSSRYTREETMGSLLKAIKHFGRVPSSYQYQQYAREAGLISYPVLVKHIGPREVWEKVLEAEKRMPDGIPSTDSTLASGVSTSEVPAGGVSADGAAIGGSAVGSTPAGEMAQNTLSEGKEEDRNTSPREKLNVVVAEQREDEITLAIVSGATDLIINLNGKPTKVHVTFGNTG